MNRTAASRHLSNIIKQSLLYYNHPVRVCRSLTRYCAIGTQPSSLNRKGLTGILDSQMETIIGTDEAGYGPNYGPLVIAATRWEVTDANVDLRDILRNAICQTTSHEEDSRIEVADSKSLFAAHQTLARLERGVLSFCSQLFECPNRFSALFARLTDRFKLSDQNEMLFEMTSDACPVDACPDRLVQDEAALRRQLVDTGIRFTGMQIRCVFPSQFNNLLETRGNKATLLSHETLSLVNQMMPANGNVKILCDKHGGRSKYAGLIQHCLTERPVQVGHESLESSRYNWLDFDRRCSCEFIAKGESNVPIALASMTAKYVRERFMNAWNRFWLSHIPGLKPTAGYPLDAKRFRLAIADKQKELGIEEREIWRAK